MPGTTGRGYPYPHDTDPINVAVDIQLLAEAINTDMSSVINTGGAYDQQQDAALAANAAQDTVDRARAEAINEYLYGLINANAAQDAVDRQRAEDIHGYHVTQNAEQRADMAVIAARTNANFTGQRTYGSNVGITTDGNAYAAVLYPQDPFGNTMFAVGSAPVVQISSPNRPPGYWLFGVVYNQNWNGFGSHWAYNTGPSWVVNASFIISYTATGPNP